MFKNIINNNDEDDIEELPSNINKNKKKKKEQNVQNKKQKEEKIVGFKLGIKDNKNVKEKKVIIVAKYICYIF